MTDFDRLRHLPELAPSPGQADAALVVVRARRRRSLLRAGAATGAAALVAAVMTTTGPSTSVLDQAGEGVKKTATAVPSPTGHGGETDSVTGPRLAPTGPGATSPGPSGATGGSPPAVVAQPGSSPRASRSDVAPRPRPAVRKKLQNAVEARLDEEGPPPSCTPTPGGGTCGGILHEHGTDFMTFRVTVCTGMGETIEFPGEQEIDLVVRTYDGGDELWRWGRGQRFAREPHTIQLDAEECVSWFLDWDYGDEAGRRVAPGRYRVEMPVLSNPQMLYGTTVDVPQQ